MASSAYRARRDSLPPLPANLAALQIQGRWAQTTQHQAFLLFDEQNGNDRIICFCSEEDLQQMCDSDVLYMDGTFNTAPRMFAQLYTIHGFLQGKQMPLAYAMPYLQVNFIIQYMCDFHVPPVEAWLLYLITFFFKKKKCWIPNLEFETYFPTFTEMFLKVFLRDFDDIKTGIQNNNIDLKDNAPQGQILVRKSNKLKILIYGSTDP